MKDFYDERGKKLKDGQIIKVYHFTSRKKHRYMYKQIGIINGHFCAYHLPKTNIESAYWLKAVADENGKIEGTRIVQCYCDHCVWKAKDCYK